MAQLSERVMHLQRSAKPIRGWSKRWRSYLDSFMFSARLGCWTGLLSRYIDMTEPGISLLNNNNNNHYYTVLVE